MACYDPDMEHEGYPPDEAIQEAARGIGAAAAALFQDRQVLAGARRQMQEAGWDAQDAVLAAVHARMPEDRELAEEFSGWLLRDLAAEIAPTSGGLRRLVDGEDILISVLGDLVPVLGALEFRGRKPFLFLVRNRLDWKLQDKLRAARAACRREDRRQPLPEGDVLPAAGDGRPSTRMADWRTFVARLAPQERKIVDLRSRGYSAAEIGERLQLKAAAVRKRLQRIREQFRRWQG